MIYKIVVTIISKNEENNVFMEFNDEDMLTAMETVEGMLRFSKGDEVSIYVKRVKK